LFALWTENGVYFITRMKENADYVVVKNLESPERRNIVSDQLIQFAGYTAKKNCPHILCRVVVWDEEQERYIVLLTNHLEFGATTISAIYKEDTQPCRMMSTTN
jgi:hypothetical protein